MNPIREFKSHWKINLPNPRKEPVMLLSRRLFDMSISSNFWLFPGEPGHRARETSKLLKFLRYFTENYIVVRTQGIEVAVSGPKRLVCCRKFNSIQCAEFPNHLRGFQLTQKFHPEKICSKWEKSFKQVRFVKTEVTFRSFEQLVTWL